MTMSIGGLGWWEPEEVWRGLPVRADVQTQNNVGVTGEGGAAERGHGHQPNLSRVGGDCELVRRL